MTGKHSLQGTVQIPSEGVAFYDWFHDIDWHALIVGAQRRLDIVVYYYDSWVGKHSESLKSFFRKPQTQLRIVVANPNSPDVAKTLKCIFGRDVHATQLIAKVKHTGRRFVNRALAVDADPGRVKFYYLPHVLHYAAHCIDDHLLVLSFFEYGRKYQIGTPALVIDLEKAPTVKEFWQREWKAILDKAKEQAQRVPKETTNRRHTLCAPESRKNTIKTPARHKTQTNASGVTTATPASSLLEREAVSRSSPVLDGEPQRAVVARPKPYTPEQIKDALKIDMRDFVVASPKMYDEVLPLTARAAAEDYTVLITGESGTGKEVIAKAVHANSMRADKTFAIVNCAGIAESVLESELFGHEKGAFTGAISRKVGHFENANHGTIFLDEIGELTLRAQASLLRIVETKAFTRVGGTETITANVRIIAATNRDLQSMANEGRFRSDLLYRLMVLHIHIPPLRERREDIVPLLRYYSARVAERRQAGSLTSREMEFSDEALAILEAYDWHGNVRELDNFVRACSIMNIEIIQRKECLAFLRQTVQHTNQLRDALTRHKGKVDLVAREFKVSPATVYRWLAQSGLKAKKFHETRNREGGKEQM